MGLEPVVGEHVLSVQGHTAGSDEERAGDINAFIADDGIKALLCVTGGTGALPLLPNIDFENLVRAEKIFVGADDNNVIAIAAAEKGLVTFYGPNLDDIKTKSQMEHFRDYLFGESKSTKEIVAATKCGEFNFNKDYVPVFGVAEGKLVGGNLTALTSLFGTPFQPALADRLLLVDDRDERNDILDRWFTMLHVSGELEKTKAVILGPFENCDSRGSYNLLSIEDDLGERLVALKKASRFDFPIGGCSLVPIGVKARFDSRAGTLTFLESIFA
jgi:muramoyltetrapeptide carboxypeptidase